jgi:hypothetical protein
MTDRGRAGTYAAEEAAFGGTDLDTPLPPARLDELIATVTAGEWWQACGVPAVTAVAARADAVSSSAASRGAGGVAVRIARGQRTVATVAHELAHALAGVDHGHDATFRAAEVDIVAMLAGAATANDLHGALAAHGVPAGQRSWPPPFRATGHGFAIVP